MNICIEFTDGPAVGVEFPGDGLLCVLHLLFFRVMFVTDELMKEITSE